MSSAPNLSVCMIVKNEAENLGGILSDCVSFADEIVVVDTGSTDSTRSIAAQFTSNVYDFKWIDNFSAARNFAMSRATGRYHLWLDADDRVSPEDQGHINLLKSHFDGRKGFYFILENQQADTERTSCLQLRCTPLVPEVRFAGCIHEQLYPSAVREGLQLVNTDIVIRHTGYMTNETRIAKAKRNLEMLERERARGANHSGVYFYLALTHAPLGNREESIKCMLQALELLKKEDSFHHLVPEGYIFLAKVSAEMEDMDSSLRYLLKARSLVNGNPAQNFQMGILFQRLGRHVEAIECLREATKNSQVPGLFPTQPLPHNAEIFLHMAYSFYCINDKQSALKLIEASSAATSQPSRGWEWMGIKGCACDNLAFAKLAFETALRFGDLEPRSWGYLANIYKSQGFIERGEECRKRAEN